MHIELTSILDQFDTVQARIHKFADNLTETRWVERADAAPWSVAECMAHLNLFGRACAGRAGLAVIAPQKLLCPSVTFAPNKGSHSG